MGPAVQIPTIEAASKVCSSHVLNSLKHEDKKRKTTSEEESLHKRCFCKGAELGHALTCQLGMHSRELSLVYSVAKSTLQNFTFRTWLKRWPV